MVIINQNIENVLNRIYLEGITYQGKAPDLFFEATEKLKKLDKSVLNVYAKAVNNAPYGWKIENALVLVVGKLMFLYEKEIDKNGNCNIIVFEVAENGQIVNEKLNRVLSLIERVENLYQA